jgi:hypothetical protein
VAPDSGIQTKIGGTMRLSQGAGATSAHSGARVAQTRAAGGRVSPEPSGCARSAPRGRESAVVAIRGAAPSGAANSLEFFDID